MRATPPPLCDFLLMNSALNPCCWRSVKSSQALSSPLSHVSVTIQMSRSEDTMYWWRRVSLFLKDWVFHRPILRWSCDCKQNWGPRLVSIQWSAVGHTKWPQSTSDVSRKWNFLWFLPAFTPHLCLLWSLSSLILSTTSCGSIFRSFLCDKVWPRSRRNPFEYLVGCSNDRWPLFWRCVVMSYLSERKFLDFTVRIFKSMTKHSKHLDPDIFMLNPSTFQSYQSTKSRENPVKHTFLLRRAAC